MKTIQRSSIIIWLIIIFEFHETYAVVEVQKLPFPEEYHIGYHVYGAMTLASNKKIYIGTCLNQKSAILIEFDTQTSKTKSYSIDKVQTLNTHGLQEPHSKIHTKPVEYKDGSIIFGTHFDGITQKWGNSHPYSYPGAHWVRFNPYTEKLEDLGPGTLPHDGLISMAIDYERDRLYGLTWPRGNLVSFNLNNREWLNLGRVSDGYDICRALVIGINGKVYGSFSPNKIFSYDPNTDLIIELKSQLPKDILTNRTKKFLNQNWSTVCWDEKSKNIYAVHNGSNSLIEIDSTDNVKIKGVILGPIRNSEIKPSRTLLNSDDFLYYIGSDSIYTYLFEIDKKNNKIDNLGFLQTSCGIDVLSCDGGVYMDQSLILFTSLHPYGKQTDKYWNVEDKEKWDNDKQAMVQAPFSLVKVNLK